MTDEDEQEPVDLKGHGQKWLDRLDEAEKHFNGYFGECETVDKAYADLSALASGRNADREYQMFWANMEVLRPIVYSRPPKPLVAPRHRDRLPVPRKAAEVLERALEADVEMDDLHDTLKLVRDDLVVSARGVPWVLDTGQCIHVDRKDFLHEPARHWKEVGWVARRAYLGRIEGVARFGDDFLRAEMAEPEMGEDDDYSHDRKASVWEIWDQKSGTVIWVTQGVEDALDVQPPLFDVKGFFPCPRPAYGTLERRSLMPVPDLCFYRDQIDEINELTDRIASLSESLRLKGFYASGSADVSDAIETAIRSTDNAAILVPVASLAAFGTGSVADSIIWLPVKEVAEVIASLVSLRQQLIADVYEITGLSDIMRGATDPNETAKAQTLKAQYGAVRVREKQAEMARIALDILRIKAEIFTESFDIREILEMAQVNDLPSQADIQPDEQGQMPDVVTVEAVDTLFKAEHSRPFVLEVETDSTIHPDEDAEKASRMEFLQAIGGFIRETGPMLAQQPQLGPFVSEMLKFTASSFRAGRELDTAIDEMAEQIASMGQQQQGPSPEQMESETKAQEAQQKQQLEVAKLRHTQQLDTAKFEMQAASQQRKDEREDARLRFDIAKTGQELGLKVDKARLEEMQAEIDAMLKVEEMDMEREQRRPVAFGDG